MFWYTMTIVATINGHMTFATHDFNSMKLCLSAKSDMQTVLKKYDPVISCEPKLGEI